MPTVVNGIGTWYYGKKRIHRFKGTCSFCNRVGELESYDTTLYFVVFFVPLLPLSHKRVLEVCPYCQKHRVIGLKQWEKQKADAIERLLEKLKQDPDNRDTIREGIALASSFQDEELFEKLAAGLAKDRLDDAAIQFQLGEAYAYFARWPEAEEAYRAALAAEDNRGTRPQLAMALLKQGRPEEAAPYLQHILEEKQRDQVGWLYYLVEGYQANGQHEEALLVMDQRDEAFPDLVKDKDLKKQRKLSERHRQSGKPIKSIYLGESAKTGYRPGGWTARVPRLIGPIVLLGLLCWYFGAAIWIGQAHRVYVVNGWDKPYSVAIAGKELTLQPGQATSVRVPEGEVSVEIHCGQLPKEPDTCRIETPFFSRPFTGPTFVLNPDKLAIVLKERTAYEEVPHPSPPPEVHAGKTMFAFEGIDYEFTPFPQTMDIQQGQVVWKTRVSVWAPPDAESRFNVVSRALPAQEQIDYAKRWLQSEPESTVFLYWLAARLSPEEALAFLEKRLQEQPILVEWHLLYQKLSRDVHPDTDLTPRYRQLVADTNENPEALYLLARTQIWYTKHLEDRGIEEGEKLLHRAASANPPSAYAMLSLGYRDLEQGQFNTAADWAEKAHRLAPNNAYIQNWYQKSLLAAKRYDTLLEQIQSELKKSRLNPDLLFEQLRIYTLKGDKANAKATMDEALQLYQGSDAQPFQEMMRTSLDLIVHLSRRDRPAFLRLTAKHPEYSPFERAILETKLNEAAALAGQDREQAPIRQALVYLAALQKRDQKLADEHWQVLLTALEHGHGSERRLRELFSSGKPVPFEELRRLPMAAEHKRVFLVVAARRTPDASKPMIQLARQLDFLPDATSLCLSKVLE